MYNNHYCRTLCILVTMKHTAETCPFNRSVLVEGSFNIIKYQNGTRKVDKKSVPCSEVSSVYSGVSFIKKLRFHCIIVYICWTCSYYKWVIVFTKRDYMYLKNDVHTAQTLLQYSIHLPMLVISSCPYKERFHSIIHTH